MKRILVSIFLIFYLGIASGATVHFHYCMGELVKLTLAAQEEESCNFCGSTGTGFQKESCCKDNYQQAKVSQSHKTVPTVYQFKQAQPAILVQTLQQVNHQPLPIETGKAALSNAPPSTQNVPVFILHCTYRI